MPTARDWEHIKEIWERGAADLEKVIGLYNVSMPEVSLKAVQEGWPDRGSQKPIVGDLGFPILDDNQVILAHKTDLGRLRMLAACVMESAETETDIMKVLKITERLSKIYSQVIPLERKVFGLDDNSGDIPDGIFVTVGRNKSGPEA